MKLKFEVLGCGSFEGHTREGKTFQKLRMMGFVLDCDGSKVPATCDMGYNSTMDAEPKSGECVIVDINSLDMKNAMASMTFISLSHVSPSAREVKH